MSTIGLLEPSAVEDPHRFFEPVRDADPIQWSERHRAWIIMGHPELDEAFRDRRLSTERMGGFRDRLTGRRAGALAKAIDLLEGWMLFHEPPEHTRLRSEPSSLPDARRGCARYARRRAPRPPHRVDFHRP